MEKKKTTKAERLINRVFIRLVDILSKYKNTELTVDKASMLLSLVFYPEDNIKFSPLTKEVEYKMGEYVVNGDIFANGDIILYVSSELSKFLSSILSKNNWVKSFSGQNQLFDETSNLLDKMYEIRDNIDRLTETFPGITNQGYREYFSNEENIENWAIVAIDEIKEKEFSKVVGLFDLMFEDGHPVKENLFDKIEKEVPRSKIRGVF